MNIPMKPKDLMPRVHDIEMRWLRSLSALRTNRAPENGISFAGWTLDIYREEMNT